MKVNSKKCLIISDGPVPTPEHQKVEGGGLRCWGLAKGILSNNSNIEITVAYNEVYRQENFTDSQDGIQIVTWNEKTIATLVSEYETVLVSYCMGGLSLQVVEALSNEQQLILDCYVPIYVEMSARNSADVAGEYEAFSFELDRWAQVLKRGDAFLCANKPQKEFYEGVLAAVGRINPVTYGKELIQIVPYGIYRDEPIASHAPVSKVLKNKKALKVLWFGGIYPWFDLTNLMQAIKLVNQKTAAELIIVGAKNPFNKHPDFVKKYEEIESYVEKNNLQNSIHLIDWVDFKDRANWYLDSDVVVVVNEEGPENKLAWRTRLVDFVWADLPIVTNGGDPLSELLLEKNAAFKLKGLSAAEIANSITEIADNKALVAEYKLNIREVRKDLYWDIATKSVAETIVAHTKAPDLTFQADLSVLHSGNIGTVSSLKSKIAKIPRYYKKYGARSTAITVKTKLADKIGGLSGTAEKRDPKVIVISHQLDLSGAPFVLLDIVSKMAEIPEVKPKIDFRTFNPVASQNVKKLNSMGVKPKIYLNKETGFTFVQDDVVVLNSFAHSTTLINSILSGLESGKIKKVLWYGHEATPKGFISQVDARRIGKLLQKSNLHIYATAEDCMQKYIAYFGTDVNIQKMPYKFDMPKDEFHALKADDFKKLSFVLPGTVSDGRKGQMPVLYAFIDFYNNFFKKNPDQYRDFSLTFVGLDKDFLSEQLIKSGEGSLGDKFIHYPKVSREENLAITKKANVTICYSLQEALPLFVYEGMAYGHPLIRNESSGMAEQIIDGVNGFVVSSDDYTSLVQAIEKIANINTVSSVELAKMSESSVDLALKATENHYKLIDQL